MLAPSANPTCTDTDCTFVNCKGNRVRVLQETLEAPKWYEFFAGGGSGSGGGGGGGGGSSSSGGGGGGAGPRCAVIEVIVVHHKNRGRGEGPIAFRLDAEAAAFTHVYLKYARPVLTSSTSAPYLFPTAHGEQHCTHSFGANWLALQQRHSAPWEVPYTPRMNRHIHVKHVIEQLLGDLTDIRGHAHVMGNQPKSWAFYGPTSESMAAAAVIAEMAKERKAYKAARAQRGV
jgi:hypothetical protein